MRGNRFGKRELSKVMSMFGLRPLEREIADVSNDLSDPVDNHEVRHPAVFIIN